MESDKTYELESGFEIRTSQTVDEIQIIIKELNECLTFMETTDPETAIVLLSSIKYIERSEGLILDEELKAWISYIEQEIVLKEGKYRWNKSFNEITDRTFLGFVRLVGGMPENDANVIDLMEYGVCYTQESYRILSMCSLYEDLIHRIQILLDAVRSYKSAKCTGESLSSLKDIAEANGLIYGRKISEILYDCTNLILYENGEFKWKQWVPNFLPMLRHTWDLRLRKRKSSNIVIIKATFGIADEEPEDVENLVSQIAAGGIQDKSANQEEETNAKSCMSEDQVEAFKDKKEVMSDLEEVRSNSSRLNNSTDKHRYLSDNNAHMSNITDVVNVEQHMLVEHSDIQTSSPQVSQVSVDLDVFIKICSDLQNINKEMLNKIGMISEWSDKELEKSISVTRLLSDLKTEFDVIRLKYELEIEKKNREYENTLKCVKDNLAELTNVLETMT